MRAGTCKHFNGVMNIQCEAGVSYSQFSPIPCIRQLAKNSRCEHYEEPTEAEIAEFQHLIEVALQGLDQLSPILAKIKQEHKGRRWQGEATCPICGGKLSIAHYPNGHTAGRCATEKCLGWIE